MCHLTTAKLLTALLLPISALASKTPSSWAPRDYEPTLIENDGTSANRYDVRKTLAYVDSETINVNNVYMVYWITTTEGRKYHITSNAGLIGANTMGTFLSVNDLQSLTDRGGSISVNGSANTEHLDMRSTPQNVTSPSDGDLWNNTRFSIDIDNVQMDVSVQPTGGNFYYGGGGGIQLVEKAGASDSYSKVVPGWSWYWANPHMHLNGSLTIDGVAQEIDPAESFGLFERQWGDFGIGPSYYALWMYFETGEVLISWIMEPALNGTHKSGFASVWHPGGLHEMMPVGPKTTAWDITASNTTGRNYFNKFRLDLPARGASITFSKWVENAEIIPTLPEQRSSYITISESYGEGVALWNGKKVKVIGHVEQIGKFV